MEQASQAAGRSGDELIVEGIIEFRKNLNALGVVIGLPGTFKIDAHGRGVRVSDEGRNEDHTAMVRRTGGRGYRHAADEADGDGSDAARTQATPMSGSACLWYGETSSPPAGRCTLHFYRMASMTIEDGVVDEADAASAMANSVRVLDGEIEQTLKRQRYPEVVTGTAMSDQRRPGRSESAKM